MKYLKYLRYIARHKWFVLLACFRRGLYWQGIVHDWSKLLPDEFFPYAEFFYGFKPSPAVEEYAKREGWPVPDKEKIRAAFDVAWLKHQHRSPHHWQHWLLREDGGALKIMEMPECYRLEMLADWEGAGRAITGKIDTAAWYAKHRHNIILHPVTLARVDKDLGLCAPA